MSGLTERDHIQQLKPCVLLSTSHKNLYGFRRLGMQHDLFVMYLYCLLWSVFAINTCDCTHICLCVFYIVQRWVTLGLRAGVGLVAPMKEKDYIQLFLVFYKCMQTIKLRQTTENNVGPFMSKSDAKGVP